MKNTIFLTVIISAITVLTAIGCRPQPITNPYPTFTPTEFVLLDDFSDGDNRTDTGAFGGYWYTFDDAAAQLNPVASPNSNCGDSSIWPISDAVARQTPNCTPTFIVSNYTAAGAIPAPARTNDSQNFARVYGNVDRSTAGYMYGFAGFGCNLLNVDPVTGYKVTINASALGYKRLSFWYRNGPTATGPTPWKVKLPNSALVGGTGPCRMEEVDDVPVCKFTSTSDWQLFDKALAAPDFANEGWGKTACGTRGPMTQCAALVGGLSYYNNGDTYKNTASEALPWLNAIQWQTNFETTSAVNTFDLEIAQVVFLK
jgi:hypothetical protein